MIILQGSFSHDFESLHVVRHLMMHLWQCLSPILISVSFFLSSHWQFNLFIGDVNIKPEFHLLEAKNTLIKLARNSDAVTLSWFLQRWNNNAGGTNPLFAPPHNPTGDRPQQQRLAFFLFPGDCTGSLPSPSGWPLSSSHLASPAFNRTMFCLFVCLSSQSAPPILVCNLSTRPSQPPQEHYAPSGVFIPPRGLLGAAMCSSLSPSSPRDSLCNGIVISFDSMMSWWD